MKLHWQIALIGMMFSILIVHPVAAQAPLCSGPGINLLAHRLDAQTVTVQFSVCDRNGVSIDTLAPGSIRLAEDGMVVANARIDSFVADRAQPVVAVDLVNGARQELSAIGASIGIVFDATELLNGTGANMRDHIGSGRVAIEEFLLEPGNPPPPRTMAPNNRPRRAAGRWRSAPRCPRLRPPSWFPAAPRAGCDIVRIRGVRGPRGARPGRGCRCRTTDTER